MINLRRVDYNCTTDRFSSFSTPQFRTAESIFGNFGEPLEHGASLLGEGEIEQEQDRVEENIPTNDALRAGVDEVILEDSPRENGTRSTNSI